LLMRQHLIDKYYPKGDVPSDDIEAA